MPIQNTKDALQQKIEILKTIQQELRHFYMTTNDLDESDGIRQLLNEVAETLYTKETELDSLEAVSEIPPVSDAEKETLTSILQQLDSYVRSDQNVHMCVSYLTQIAERVKRT